MNNMEKILDHIETIKKLLWIVPLFFILGIAYQFIILLRIEQIWIFSWNQVVNDTLKISIPIILGQILFHLGIKQIRNWNKEKTWGYVILDILGVFVLLLLVIWVICVIFLNGNDEYIRNASFLLILPYFWGLLVGYDMIGKKDDSLKKILMSLVIFLFTCINIARFEFQDLYLKVCSEFTCKSEIVIYANDKYVVSKLWFIYQNNDNIVFYRKPKT